MVLTTPKILTAFLIVVILTAFFVCTYIPLNKNSEAIMITIDPGDGAIAISEKLHNLNIIRSKYTFVLYTLINGVDKKLKAGVYSFSASMNIPFIIDKLVNGFVENTDIVVKIPEGFNAWDIDRRLADTGLIEEGEFSVKALSYEGYLFPDTYRFDRRSTADEIIEKMRQNFDDKIADAGLIPTKDQLIMASIIEKEVRSEKDMKLVSGVLWKRIAIGMPLQVDSAVIYNACKIEERETCYFGSIPVRKYLSVDGPYNTYIRKELPEAPISNPGLQSIIAAISPTPSSYLFYLSATAEDGRTIFSKTGTEHERNRKKYIGR